MEPTLEAAFEAMFSANPQMPENEAETPTEQVQPVNEDLYSLSQKLTEKYNQAKQFMSENDWENYGKTMKEVDAIVKDMQQLNEEIAQQQPAVTPPAESDSPDSTPTPSPTPEEPSMTW